MLKELKDQHREVARLKFEGFKPAEIAERTGKSLSNIYSILSDPICQAHISSLADKADSNVIDARKRFIDMVAKGLDVYDNVLDHPDFYDPKIVVKVASDVFDRAGYKPTQRHEHAHAHLTADDIAELKRRAMAAYEKDSRRIKDQDVIEAIVN